MNIDTQVKIKNNPNLYHYLRENSWWYKELNRHPEALKDLEYEMKSYYKLNITDRIDKFSKNIEMLKTLMDILN